MAERARCPFCGPANVAVCIEGKSVLGLWDQYPVSDGHLLLVTKQHRETWFDATEDERVELMSLTLKAKELIQRRDPSVRDFNIGVNVGAAAGQTVFHLHVHVIPRREGDVSEPRGGVRGVIPARRDYRVLPSPPRLTTGGAVPLLPQLGAALVRAKSLDAAVAFIMPSGVHQLRPYLEEFLERGGRLRLVTGDYLGITAPEALRELLDLQVAFPQSRIEARAYSNGKQSFHPKAYIIDGQLAFVGSSNVSSAALTTGVEWNYRVVESADARGLGEIRAAFEQLWAHESVTTIDASWLEDYEARRREPSIPVPEVADAAPETIEPPPPPNAIQREALARLDETRALGFRAGLVVMATGLGKTWLSAFDSESFRRVLFVAHRDEILQQALSTFRRVRPRSSFGTFTGEKKDLRADVLFASVATLSRQTHLQEFAKQAFDYVVIDEFHHAAASTYRRLIEHFEPKFMLGLTATPSRSDGDDLLALCQDNLVFEADVVRGIREGLLSPFAYFGVPDTIDYDNIPWRSRQFDLEALTKEAATQERAQNALEQWRLHGGGKTLAFCVSQAHADFMRDYFRENGVACAVVHSGSNSDGRVESLAQLARGELQVVFAVDMFNEGVDLPSIDTVLMLRPTESTIVWLQQFGRGLRRAPGKERLVVIDYIGNHRSFLLKARTLLQLPAGDDKQLNEAFAKLQAGEFALPPGCSVTYDLKSIDLMRALLRLPNAAGDALGAYYDDFKERRGQRPTAHQAFHDGYVVRRAAGQSWLEYVDSRGDFSAGERSVLGRWVELLRLLEVTPMTKSYKMVLLLALLNRGALPGDGLELKALVAEVRRMVTADPRLIADFGAHLENDRVLSRALEEHPIAAWVAEPYFSFEDERFSVRGVTERDAPLGAMVRELVEWRLAEYLQRSVTPPGVIRLKVSHANRNPILFYPAREVGLPKGWTKLEINGASYEGNFVKVALNVVRKAGESSNQLPTLLRAWFGPTAGHPGTNHSVALTKIGDSWRLAPLGVTIKQGPELWRAYSREQIPPLFGEVFSQAVWNVGFVPKLNGERKRLFLLVTLDKDDMHGGFEYRDHFLSPDLFEWQSQNRESQETTRGKSIRDHEKLGTEVHLFVRKTKKDSRGAAMPFVYCGQVRFESWEGNKPITVRWRLRELLPDRFFLQFREA